MRRTILLTFAAMGALFSICSKAAEEAAGTGPYHVDRVMKVGGEGRWDDLFIDPATHLLYISRQTHTQVISADDGKLVADIKETAGVHGVAIVPEVGRGFTSNGKANSVTVFDLKTYATIGTIPAGENPDCIRYDAFSKRIWVCNGKSHDVTVIDPSAAPGPSAVVGKVPVGGKLEFAVSDGNGHLYVNIEDRGAIVDIDTTTMKVAHDWKIEGGEEPSGLAIDVEHHRLFAGCDGNSVMAILDSQTGKTLATLPIGKGVDGCAFDPASGEAMASCGGDGTLSIVKETSPGKFEVVQKLQTRPGARTITLDATKHTCYLPTAELEPAVGAARPVPKPDTFMVVVVSRK